VRLRQEFYGKAHGKPFAFCLARKCQSSLLTLLTGSGDLLPSHANHAFDIFNRRHKLFGHLFSGGYQALPVDGSGTGWTGRIKLATPLPYFPDSPRLPR
jgi:hypothetical protein